MLIAVCSERSSCPCLCSGVDEKSVSRSVGSWNFQGAFPVKEKYRPCSIAMDFVGWNSGKMNRVCCGAVNFSGIIHGEAVFKMNTTTSCGETWTTPQNQWDLQEKYHCMWNSSRGIWKIYGSKVGKVWRIFGQSSKISRIQPHRRSLPAPCNRKKKTRNSRWIFSASMLQ